jgi:hypothetical protein
VLHRTYNGSVERGEQIISLAHVAKLAETPGVAQAELFPPLPIGLTLHPEPIVSSRSSPE